MALRVVLNRTKPWGCWGYQLVKGKIGSSGAVLSNRSIVGQNLLFNFNTRLLPVSFHQSCRHYFLPPPPPVEIIDDILYEDESTVVTVINLKSALKAARFALQMYNDTEVLVLFIFV